MIYYRIGTTTADGKFRPIRGLIFAKRIPATLCIDRLKKKELVIKREQIGRTR